MFGSYAYDGINDRKFTVEYASVGDQPGERLAILELYSTKRAYVTNLQTQKCLYYRMCTQTALHC